jgi:beta-ketodecanoyl-[acyl-carrier-protein] synthase
MSSDIVAGINWIAERKSSGAIDFAAANFSISSADSNNDCSSPANATHNAICGLVNTGVSFVMAAADMIAAGHARAILVVNPEICSAHLNWRDRDSHFIFGDVATAILLEREDLGTGGWAIIGTKLKTKFSNNIRNNFGFLNRTERAAGETAANGAPKDDKLFVQEGRKVFKEVVPMVSDMIRAHMDELGLSPDDMRRVWLHQANINMNLMIAKKVFGRDAGGEDAPTILDDYANTSSAGSIIAFHLHSDDLKAGDKGVICSFGAGYSAGTVFVEKLA